MTTLREELSQFKNLPDGSAPLLARAEALARQVVS
jgi:hypothetical protein